MELLGKTLGEYDCHGMSWASRLADWFKDSCYSLADLANDPQEAEVLATFEDIVYRAGCTDQTQVEYVFGIEERIQRLEDMVSILVGHLEQGLKAGARRNDNGF